MLNSIKQRMDREDEGFTLIELMVVLLIIAILLAIAIPTFLGARNTANARSTQENLRNALTAEHTNWTSNQTFTTGLSSIEPSLNWGTATVTTKGGRDVSAKVYDATVASGAVTSWTADASQTAPTNADGVALVGYGKDNNCYAIFQSNNASADFTAYTEWPAPSTGCAQPSTLPTSAPTGTGASQNMTSASNGSTWYPSF